MSRKFFNPAFLRWKGFSNLGYLKSTFSHPNENIMLIEEKEEKFEFPPSQLMEYKEPVGNHKNSGKRDFERLKSILNDYQEGYLNDKKVLEFGCSNSRVLRYFVDESLKNMEVWGCDINSNVIHWCIENFSPHINFFTNTTHPHLPFKDNSLDFVYAYSIFTHIDDLFFMWILEFKRILKKGGLLLMTTLDKESVQFGLENKSSNIGKHIQNHQGLFQSFLNDELNLLSINRGIFSQVFVQEKFLKSVLSYGWECCSISLNTMGGHQKAYLFKSI